MKKPLHHSLRRWRRGSLALIAGSFLGLAAGAPSASSTRPLMKIHLIVGEQVAIATLYDNAIARDFAKLLPLSSTLTDYDVIERVSELPRKLSTQGAPEGMAPEAGELAHYAPWSNLAIFIEPRSYSRNLLPLGKVDEGLSILAQPGPYQARIECAEPRSPDLN